MVSVWWSAAHLIHYSFQSPSDTMTSEKWAQQTNEIHWKLQPLRLVLVNRTGPVLQKQSQPVFKSWTNWAMKLCLICHIHLTSRQPTTTSSNISTTFFQGKCFHNQQRQKTLSKGSLNPETDFYTIGRKKKTPFLLAKNVLIIMVPILMNKG